MNSLAKAYHVLRLLGPGFVNRRLKLRARELMGSTRRAFPATPWSEIDPSVILRQGTPTDAKEYQQFKRGSAPEFVFPLGKPPEIPLSVRGDELEHSLSLAKLIFLHILSKLHPGFIVYMSPKTSKTALKLCLKTKSL